MVSKFGTSFSDGTGSIDLTSYAKKTTLTPITQVTEDLKTKQTALRVDVELLQAKIPEIEQMVDTVEKMEGPRGQRGPRGLKGDKGDKGLTGQRGATWHNSFGDPNTEGPQGEHNDYAIDSISGKVYKRYGNPPVWNAFGSMKGPQGERGEQGDRGLVNLQTITGTYNTNERQTVLRFPDGKSLDVGNIIILGVYIRQDSSWITLDSQTHIKLVCDNQGMHLERATSTIINGRINALRFDTFSSDSVRNVDYLVQYSILDNE